MPLIYSGFSRGRDKGLPFLKELQEAEATLRQVQADTLSEFIKELAVTEKELHETQARLTLVLAGSRQEDIDATEAEIARLNVRRDHLEQQLQLLHVIAPHAGVITTPRMKEKLGQLVSKGELIAEVHDLRTIEAEIAVPEHEHRRRGTGTAGASQSSRLRSGDLFGNGDRHRSGRD